LYIVSWFRQNKIRIFLILFFYPSIVCFTPDSTGTSNTFLEFMMGVGKYANVSYNCEGEVTDVDKYQYFDYGAVVSHNIDEFNFGLRGGGYVIDGSQLEQFDELDINQNEIKKSGQYLNPFVGFDHKYVEINLGLLFLTEYPEYGNLSEYLINEGSTQMSGLLRIGNEKTFHFTSQYLSNIPLFSGGGMFDIGFGLGSKETRNLTWAGISAGPFQNAGIGFKQHLQLSSNFDLLLKARLGEIESNFEGSFSAGVRYNFF
ncbi:MAG: hypothetical protein ACHQLA_00595, partial [Ignavibacteriales bacterium]